MNESLPKLVRVIRPAKGSDVAFITSMLEHLAEETSLPLTFNVDRATLAVAAMLANPEVIVLVVYLPEKMDLAGFVIGWLEQDFCDETCAYVSKFYIEKDYRGTGIARDLLEAFDAECRRRGADVVFASSTAGMGETNEKLYVRLFEKHGYNVLGRVLVKEIK